MIDDETEFRTTLQDVLESKGFAVEGSRYLATSVCWGLNGDFDLITLDLRMPKVDGLEVGRQYKKLTPLLVILSGYLDEDTSEGLDTIGVRHTIAKPTGTSDLLRAVDSALTQHYTNGHAAAD